jgi:hypothetical protein
MFNRMSSSCSLKNLLVVVFVLSLTFLAACAPVSYNRYQPANTMGQGQFKLMASAELGRELAMAADFDIWEQMHHRLNEWAVDHPGYGDEIAGMEAADLLAGFTFFLLGGAFGYPVPNASIIAAYGVTDNVDLEASVSTSLYLHAGTKIRLLRFGRGALAISPAVGYLPIDSGNGEGSSGNVNFADRYQGYVANVEMPLLFGWEFTHVSPYFGLHASYQRLDLKYTMTITDFDPDFEATVNPVYDLWNVGLVAGVQFKWSAFVLTPELVWLYTAPATDEPWPRSFISPGLAIGAQW